MKDNRKAAYYVPISKEKEPYSFPSHSTRRYGVFRRSALTPLFHPFFINYGYIMVGFYERLYLESSLVLILSPPDTSFYVLPQCFGVDLPHPRCIRAHGYRENKDNEMVVLHKVMNKLSHV